MLTLNIINSRAKTCQRCGGLFRITYSTDKEVQRKLIEIHSTKQNMKFIRLLRQATNCDLKNAKGTFNHYGYEVGKCHWYKNKIEVAEFVDCPKCKSLNINPLV